MVSMTKYLYKKDHGYIKAIYRTIFFSLIFLLTATFVGIHLLGDRELIVGSGALIFAIIISSFLFFRNSFYMAGYVEISDDFIVWDNAKIPWRDVIDIKQSFNVNFVKIRFKQNGEDFFLVIQNTISFREWLTLFDDSSLVKRLKEAHARSK